MRLAAKGKGRGWKVDLPVWTQRALYFTAGPVRVLLGGWRGVGGEEDEDLASGLTKRQRGGKESSGLAKGL